MEEGRKSVEIKEIIIHGGWNSTSESFDHDIALIRLTESVEFDEYIQPIRRMNTTELKEFGKVVAWGAIDDKGKLANVAKIAKLKTIEIAECLHENRNLARIFWPESFCAVNTDRDFCRVNSGSGFFFEIDGEKYLKGIVSSNLANECSGNAVALYTDITKYYDFIQVKSYFLILISVL